MVSGGWQGSQGSAPRSGRSAAQKPPEALAGYDDSKWRARMAVPKRSPVRGSDIIDQTDLNLEKANNVCIASLNRAHKSTRRLKLKKPQ